MSYRYVAKTLIAALAAMFLASPAYAHQDMEWMDYVSVSFGLTGVAQATSGNNYGEVKDQTDYAYSADVGFVGQIAEGHTLNLVLEAGEGDAAGDNIGSRAIPNYDAFISRTPDGETRMNVSQAYYEGTFFDGALLFAAGKMDHHSITDTNEYANDETSQFLNGLFVRSTGIVFSESPYYYGPTLALTVAPVDVVSLTYTYAKHDGDDFFSKGFQVAELALHPVFGEMAGNYRAGYLHQDNGFTDYKTGSQKANTGFFVSLDQAITGDVGLFFRYARQDDTLTENEVIGAISGGAQFGGALWGRETDTVGLAYGKVELNKDLVTENNDGESVFEAYYNVGINDHLALSADVQVFSNLERPDTRNVTVYGLRLQAGF
ncbi:MAG: carbohydrate porin [Nitrospinae bacterium]|nr:carbohydrate porin [Nitrospinota bacterium]